MSATSRRSRPSAPADTPRASEQSAPSDRSVAIGSVEVVWGVARSALNGSAPAGRSRILAMTLRAESLGNGSAVVTAELADSSTGERSVLHRETGVPGEVIPDIRGHVHVEIPGWLHATIGPGRDGDAWRLVYARTPLIDRLGIRGGRAEPIRIAVAPS